MVVIRIVFGETRGTRGTVAFEKAPQNFYEKGDMDFVCASPCAHQCERSVPYVDRSRAADGVIRLLRGETAIICKRASSLLRGAIAGYRFLCNGSKPYHIGNGTIFTVFLSVIRCLGDTIAVSANSMNAHCKTYRSRRYEQPSPPIMKNVRP